MLIEKLFVLLLLASLQAVALFFILSMVKSNVQLIRSIKHKKVLSYVVGIPLSAVTAFMVYLIGSKTLAIVLHENTMSVFLS